MTASPQMALGPRQPFGFHVNIAWVLAFFALAALILNTMFGPLAVLVFLASGLALIATRPEYSLYVVARHWIILLLPAYCLASTLWSEFPTVTLRHGAQFAVTCVIAIVIANRVPPIVLHRFLYAIYGFGVLLSFAFGRVRDDIGAWIGIFGSKNAFAGVVSVFMLASLALLIDKRAHWLARVAAAASVLVAAPALVLAQSAGAIIVLIPAIGILALIHISRFTNLAQRLFFGVMLALVAAAGVVVFVAYGDAILAQVLDLSGKNPTLTGRTDLWQIGINLINQNPLFGVGYQAFWVQGSALAESLWAEFSIESRSGFNFHNTYISNAVEIGLIGVGLQVLILYGGLVGCLLWAFRNPSPASAFFSAFLVMVVGSSFVEVAVFFQFSVTSILVICAFVYAVQAGEAWRAHILGLTMQPARKAQAASGPGGPDQPELPLPQAQP
ncbi:O-antigen ligase family protein [Devosia nitrariae]|uniref:Ligase n=1 Tax=Devosia nitrariae TaxID=2071872 RepID=A0ABQ5W1G2_9HYPH|nr:O-antigen ligase family protein [Devosia nitrariae]GLQ53721.1 ligase [Devosia nitrariae]